MQTVHVLFPTDDLRRMLEGLDQVKAEISSLRSEIINTERFITMSEAQGLLGIRSRVTLLRMIDNGGVPQPTLIGKSKRFKLSEIIKAGETLRKYARN